MAEILGNSKYITLQEFCKLLQISVATGKNWIKLGKIEPQYRENGRPCFSKEYAYLYKKDIETGLNEVLKSRRNKKYVSGNSLYKSYVSKDCKSVIAIQQLLNVIEEEEIEINNQVLQIIIADCAVKLMKQRYNIGYEASESDLYDFLEGRYSFGSMDKLIYDLIDDLGKAKQWITEYHECATIQYKYEDAEDVIGLLYISCKNIGNRKATGSYYTPTNVVRELISKVFEKSRKATKILDPCCGTGNFLLQLPSGISFDNIYGYDIDDISVKITRLNMALKYSDIDVDKLYTNIRKHNYIFEIDENEYDTIIGNPPWGYSFDEEECHYLRKKYDSAKGKNIESYDVFVEQSIKSLEEDGVLAFVLPEAILNVKNHIPVRQYIMENTSIEYIEFLGNTFDKVQCPCIIMQIKNTNHKLSCIGMKVNDGRRIFEISKERDVDSECFCFSMTDDEYMVMDKILGIENATSLAGNAIFALGIVTGNNKEYISTTKTDENEMILKGSDIYKYKVKEIDNYIVYKPETFQQVAPTEYYRAPEKLLYRFISNQLVFAYDDNQTLSLNSANLLIPRIEGMHIKYILAILNSRIAQYVFKMKFNSIKVLRSHIESIPIPVITSEQQKNIIEMVDCLISEKSKKTIICTYEKLNDEVRKMYELNESEYQIVKNAVADDNKFLI